MKCITHTTTFLKTNKLSVLQANNKHIHDFQSTLKDIFIFFFNKKEKQNNNITNN